MKYAIQYGPTFTRLMIALGLLGLVGCSGGSDQSTQTFRAQVVMGPIIEANVKVFLPKDMISSNKTGEQAIPIAIGSTKDAEQLDDAGEFVIDIPTDHLEEPLYIRVSGGYDIDIDDDGQRDLDPTFNPIEFNFIIPSAHDLSNLKLTTKFNPLLLLASQYAIDTLYEQDEISKEEVKNVLKCVAKAFLIGEDKDGDGIVDDLDGDNLPDDINSDGIIDWKDIIIFNPTSAEDRDKCRMPWEHLLTQIERQRNGYTADLQLEYTKYYAFDPHVITSYENGSVMYPIDYDEDGEWKTEQDFYDFFDLIFSTNLNEYKLRDLVEGQGLIGGNVEFPEQIDLFYGYFGYTEGTNECEYQQNNATGNLPLCIACLDDSDSYLDNSGISAYVGSFIYDPERAPEGVYSVTYTVENDENIQTHKDSFYIHEISEQTYVYVIPQVFIDDQKRIDHITLRFEDANGNELKDPPILQCGIWMNPIWGDSEMANRLIRGDGYYDTSVNLYNQSIKYLDITQPIYPLNNGNKIFVEDVVPIYIGIRTGDGVERHFGFGIDGDYLPQLETLETNGSSMSVTYISSAKTNKPVDRIRYRFDNTDWYEEAGASVNPVIPDEASTFYVTATDDSGFYRYPPEELSVE